MTAVDQQSALFAEPVPCPTCKATSREGCWYEQARAARDPGDHRAYVRRPKPCPYAYDPKTQEIPF